MAQTDVDAVAEAREELRVKIDQELSRAHAYVGEVLRLKQAFDQALLDLENKKGVECTSR